MEFAMNVLGGSPIPLKFFFLIFLLKNYLE